MPPTFYSSSTPKYSSSIIIRDTCLHINLNTMAGLTPSTSICCVVVQTLVGSKCCPVLGTHDARGEESILRSRQVGSFYCCRDALITPSTQLHCCNCCHFHKINMVFVVLLLLLNSCCKLVYSSSMIRHTRTRSTQQHKQTKETSTRSRYEHSYC